jgi:hypothetical protein
MVLQTNGKKTKAKKNFDVQFQATHDELMRAEYQRKSARAGSQGPRRAMVGSTDRKADAAVSSHPKLAILSVPCGPLHSGCM